NRASNTVTVTYAPYSTGGGVTTTNYSNWKPAPAFTSTNEPLVTTQPTNLALAAGSTATFSITAAGFGTLAYQWFKDGVEMSDVETPCLMTFSLSNAPVGASINTNSGVLSWATSVTNAGTTNPFTVVVADNGSPNLTATQSFSVTVLGIGGTNTAPVFPAATNRYVINGGDTISVTNPATDAEAPPQTLTY